MQTFWKWPVRNLALVIGAASLAAGYFAVASWALALAVTCVLALLAKAADSCYQAAARRAQRKAIVSELAQARSHKRAATAAGQRMGPRRAS